MATNSDRLSREMLTNLIQIFKSAGHGHHRTRVELQPEQWSQAAEALAFLNAAIERGAASHGQAPAARTPQADSQPEDENDAHNFSICQHFDHWLIEKGALLTPHSEESDGPMAPALNWIASVEAMVAASAPADSVIAPFCQSLSLDPCTFTGLCVHCTRVAQPAPLPINLIRESLRRREGFNTFEGDDVELIKAAANILAEDWLILNHLEAKIQPTPTAQLLNQTRNKE